MSNITNYYNKYIEIAPKFVKNPFQGISLNFICVFGLIGTNEDVGSNVIVLNVSLCTFENNSIFSFLLWSSNGNVFVFGIIINSIFFVDLGISECLTISISFFSFWISTLFSNISSVFKFTSFLEIFGDKFSF